MRDVTGYPLSPNQRKEVEDFMNKHDITENEARYALGYVPLDLPQVSIEEAFDMVKKENPNLELSYKTMDIWVDEVMKRAIPKPNPKRLRGWIETTGMLCNGPSLIEMVKERGFECNNDFKVHYRYLEQCEKERNLTDAEKADKRNLEILKKW